jgi:hypothetical protein
MGFRLLAAAAVVMDEEFLGEVGAAALGTGLVDQQACRTALATGVGASEMAPLEQFQVGQNFQVLADDPAAMHDREARQGGARSGRLSDPGDRSYRLSPTPVPTRWYCTVSG